MPEKMIRAALDYSWNGAAFALMEDRNVLLSSSRFFDGHDASGLAQWIGEEAAKAGGLDRIGAWTVGTGPGSFSGLRIASAFVMGAAYGKAGVTVRGMSTASAIARTILRDHPAEKALVLFDGRRSELFAYGMEKKNGSWFFDGLKTVLSKEHPLTEEQESYTLCALEKDRAAVEALTGNALFAENVAAEELILNDPDGTEISPTDLIYLRAAVFVEPKMPRQI